MKVAGIKADFIEVSQTRMDWTYRTKILATMHIDDFGKLPPGYNVLVGTGITELENQLVFVDDYSICGRCLVEVTFVLANPTRRLEV